MLGGRMAGDAEQHIHTPARRDVTMYLNVPFSLDQTRLVANPASQMRARVELAHANGQNR